MKNESGEMRMISACKCWRPEASSGCWHPFHSSGHGPHLCQAEWGAPCLAKDLITVSTSVKEKMGVQVRGGRIKKNKNIWLLFGIFSSEILRTKSDLILPKILLIFCHISIRREQSNLWLETVSRSDVAWMLHFISWGFFCCVYKWCMWIPQMCHHTAVSKMGIKQSVSWYCLFCDVQKLLQGLSIVAGVCIEPWAISRQRKATKNISVPLAALILI